jgi:hypothetical protein
MDTSAMHAVIRIRMVVNGLNTYRRAGGPLYLAWMARKAEKITRNVRAESINLPSLFWNNQT